MILSLLLSLIPTILTYSVQEAQASCHDQGCESSLQGLGECVDVRGEDWTLLHKHYQLNATINSHNLCQQSGPEHCCMCLKKKASCSDQGCSSEWAGLGVCVDVFSKEFPDIVRDLDLTVGGREDLCGNREQGCCTCFKKQDYVSGNYEASGHDRISISEPIPEPENGHKEHSGYSDTIQHSGSTGHTEHHEHWEDYSPPGESGHHKYHGSSEQHDHEDHFGQYDYSEHAESHGLIEHHRHQGESVHYHKHGGHYHRHRGDFGESGNSEEYGQIDKELSKIVDDIFG